MKTKKPKPLTKVQQLERKVSILESAVYQAYNDYEELFALIRVFRSYSKSEDYSKYLADDYLMAVTTNIFANQTNMMDCAGLEY
jgi:hypothetical protein